MKSSVFVAVDKESGEIIKVLGNSTSYDDIPGLSTQHVIPKSGIEIHSFWIHDSRRVSVIPPYKESPMTVDSNELAQRIQDSLGLQ